MNFTNLDQLLKRFVFICVSYFEDTKNVKQNCLTCTFFRNGSTNQNGQPSGSVIVSLAI